MKVSTHIAALIIILILSVGALVFVLNAVSPSQATLVHFLVIYGLIFLAAFALMTILGFIFRSLFWRGITRHSFLRNAQRQGILFGLLTVAVVLLQSAGLLGVPTALLLFLIFVLLEFYFIGS